MEVRSWGALSHTNWAFHPRRFRPKSWAVDPFHPHLGVSTTKDRVERRIVEKDPRVNKRTQSAKATVFVCAHLARGGVLLQREGWAGQQDRGGGGEDPCFDGVERMDSSDAGRSRPLLRRPRETAKPQRVRNSPASPPRTQTMVEVWGNLTNDPADHSTRHQSVEDRTGGCGEINHLLVTARVTWRSGG